jgi:alanine racemase
VTGFAGRWAWAEVDHGALSDNVATLAALVAPAQLWAVVKADAYGHGAVPVARTALAAGASRLCVALTAEAVALREAGIDAPIMVLSEQPAENAPDIARHGIEATVTTLAGVESLQSAWSGEGGCGPVHLKIDTGMHRVGASPTDAVVLAGRIAASPNLVLAGTCTHFAVADDPAHPATSRQHGIFTDTLAAIAASGVSPGTVHAANSAAAILHPATRHDAVRVGIAMYGCPPPPAAAAAAQDLTPVLSLRARVSAVRRIGPGEAVSYGLRRPVQRPTVIATVPLGYADGVPRRLWETATPVMIGGVPRPIAGTVTMDQIMVDCGDDASVTVGDEVVLIGSSGDSRVTVEDWARDAGTISYEVLCGISARIHRRHR